MNTRIRLTLAALVAVILLAAGCAPAPQTATSEPEVRVMQVTAVPESVPVEGALSPGYSLGYSMEDVPPPEGLVPPNDEPYADTFYEDYGVNPFVDTEDDHLSTFAIDVDTASYTVMRRYVGDGHLPPDESVRVEEYVNYFEQDYEPPAEGAFAIHLEGAPSPFGGERHYLVRVGLQGYEVDPGDRDDVVLTFVIDVSGSMDMENRLGLVKQSLRMLVDELRPTDRVGIVVYGSQAWTVLETTPVGENREIILQAIDSLRPQGSTYAEEGLVMGYQMAARAYDPQATNRVILCSDGVANVGNTGPASILERIRDYAAQGIYMTSLGFGMGNYNDVLLEQLANDGDGFYAYVDTLREAERVLVERLPSTLQVIARDARVQVEFNPDVVRSYRLIGYENRDMADEDFRDDTVDAGELGPGHSVTALYEIKFHADEPSPETAMTVYVRYQDPEDGEWRELQASIGRTDFAPTFEQTSIRFQLDAVVAEYAEILRDSYWARESSLEDVLLQARRVAEYLPHDADVAEFARLVERAARIGQ
jgi:Ca-activated chloride channel family protein